MATELTPTVRDLLNRRALLRHNAAGARHMAERFDEAADAINAEIEGICAIHGDPIIHEPGGTYMPTVFGRDYCPTCQTEYAAALNAEHGSAE